MKPIPTHCGSIMHGGNSNVKLCAPLQQLKKEHISLQEKMNEFHAIAQGVVSNSHTDRQKQWKALHEQVLVFTEELEIHSRKEEEGLFLMMAKYIGREMGPIAVMEYEHDQAKDNLHQFMEAAGQVKLPVEWEEAKSIAQFAIQAHAILSEHFYKEENVLFPMAENMLSVEDKEQLHHIVEGVRQHISK